MNLEKLTCKNCGAPISPDSNIAECSHCGTPHVLRNRDESLASPIPVADVVAYRPASSARDPQSQRNAVTGGIAAAVALFFILPIFLFAAIFIFTTASAVRRSSPGVPGHFSEFRGVPGQQGNIQVEVEGDVPPELKRQLERSIRDKLR